MEFVDDKTRFNCVVIRGPHGGINGYVQIPTYHHLNKSGYGAAHEASEISVHGGLTYAGEGDAISNLGGWWFGFDTAHSGDLSPRYPRVLADEAYKNIEYVIAETKNLAHQLSVSAPFLVCEKCGQKVPRK
jgi:hypothetical protein